MSKHQNKDSQSPQFLGLSEDLASILAEWSEAFDTNDLATATKIYEQGFQKYSREAIDDWKRQYFANNTSANKFKKIPNMPNPFPPQKNCKEYLTNPCADVLYPILHVREGANKVGNAPYRKAIWEAFGHTAHVLAGGENGITADVPNCILFDLVDEFVYQVWQQSNHAIRQRNRFLVDLAAINNSSQKGATAEADAGADTAATAAAAPVDTATTGSAAAALAQSNNVRLPEFDSIPDVWQFTELYKKFSDLAAKTKIEEKLKEVAAGKIPAKDLFVSKAGSNAKQIAARVNASFGFMCLFGLIRLNVAAGDYVAALEVAKKLAWEKTGPALAESVSRAHTAIVHNIGASLMMTRRFSDAVSVLLQGLEYPATAYRRYHEQAQVQVWGLTQICSVLANVSVPDYTDRFAGMTAKAAIAKGQQSAAEDITVPMFQGDMQTFKDTFIQSMPKYIAVGFDLRTPVTEIKNLYELNPHDVLEVQLRMFLREVQQNLAAIQMRGAMKVYSAFSIDKVNQLSQGGREAAAAAAQVLQASSASASSSNVASTSSPTSATEGGNTITDAVSSLVNLKCKTIQTCEYKSDSVNPTLKLQSLLGSDSLRCVSTVDFSSDSQQVQVLRYKEITTIGVRLNEKILAMINSTSNNNTNKVAAKN